MILVSTAVDYVVGIELGRAEDARRRKRLVAIRLASNLAILGVFKYYGFFVGSFAALLESFGRQSNITVLQFVLPVGVSFYTFQTL